MHFYLLCLLNTRRKLERRKKGKKRDGLAGTADRKERGGEGRERGEKKGI